MSPAFQKSPAPLDPVPFNIPHAFYETLSNGLKVVIFEDHRLPMVSYRLAFLSGDAVDNGIVGVTSAMTSMLTEGTENYSSLQLAEKIERLGAGLAASSSDDFTVVSGSSLLIYSSEILQLMAEVIFRPTFPEEELALHRTNTLENLKYQRSQPTFLANEQTARILYGDHPYAQISSTPDDVAKWTREELIKAKERTFLPNNAVFIAVGDVNREELLSEIKDRFGDWQPGDVRQHTFPQPPTRSQRTLTIVDRPGSSQANIVLSNIAFDRGDADYFPVLVMNQILGAGASSRIFMNLREEKGYTYGAYTRFDAKKLAGDFEATAEVRTAVVGDSLKEFFYELERIRDDKVSQEELEDAISYLTGVFPLRAETQEGLTGMLVNQQLYGLPDDYLQTYRDNISAVSIDDVQRVAKRFITPDKFAMVIVGDAAEILPQVRSYTENIEVYDINGNSKDVAEYEAAAAEEPANVGGTWELSLSFMGQDVSVELTLEQDGNIVNGNLSTMLGEGTITNGKVTGNKLAATAVTELQGQQLELAISATANEDKLEGTITSAMIPTPLEFTGSRV